MSVLQTMGTQSCATIAIGQFGGDNYERNEAYKVGNLGGMKLTKPHPSHCGEYGEGNVHWFVDHVLYPLTQKLGHTFDYPFEQLMQEIEERDIGDKFTIITLNAYLKNLKGGYWVKEITRWGFEQIDMTDNSSGEMCYIYTRNTARPE